MSDLTVPHRPSLYAITAAHASVDMQTGMLPVMLPALLSSLDLNYGLAAGIVTANQIIIAIAQPLFGLYGDRRPMKNLIWLGCALTALAMALVLWLPNYYAVLAAVFASGIGSAMFHPEALTRARAVMKDQPTVGVSVFFSGGNVGFALGPILAVLFLERIGKGGVLLMLIPMMAALALLATQWGVIASSRQAGKGSSAKAGQNNWGLVIFWCY
jgi:MFS transporter, FSR family, fosmidomycin resistance protein